MTATAVANPPASTARDASFIASQAQDASQGLAGATNSDGANDLDLTPIATREAASGLTLAPESTEAPETTPEAFAAASTLSAPVTAAPEPISSADFTAEFLSLLNAQRTGRGLPALTPNDALGAAANHYAAYMGSQNFFGHFGPDGSSPSSRIAVAGYSGSYKGEALSAGQTSPQAALNALLASPPHAAILLEPTAREVGVGYAFVAGSTYKHYWSVVTGVR